MAESQAAERRLFLGEAKRTLEAGDKFCWVGAFSSGEHAAPAPPRMALVFFTYPKIRNPSSFVARMAETVARAAAKVVT